MSLFLTAANHNLINADDIERIEHQTSGAKGEEWSAIAVMRKSHERIRLDRPYHAVVQQMQPTIAAAPGYTLLAIRFEYDDIPIIERLPVIGWRVLYYSKRAAEPIVPESHWLIDDDGELYTPCILCPDGRVIDQSGLVIHASEQEFLAASLARSKERALKDREAQAHVSDQ